MLTKMGWSEGTGLGRERDGITEPVKAIGSMSRKALGTDSHSLSHSLSPSPSLSLSTSSSSPSSSLPYSIPKGDEDEYETYKKRMAESYRHRPNPMVS